MTLDKLSKKIDEINVKNTYLYFITRVVKPDLRKTSKVLDKYLFKAYQIDVNDEIREHLHSLTKEQLDYLLKKKTVFHDYDVITDDAEHLFTYNMKNKAMSFSDVVTNQLNSNPPKIISLEDIIKEEELWAYSVGFHDSESNDWVYTFRKVLRGKVAIDEKDGNSRNALSKFFRTRFNSKTQKLELIEGETVNLDKQVDCFYFEDTFFITKKTQFEQIVGLEEEYKNMAKNIVTDLATTNMIIGLEIISDQIEKNPAMHKKLVRLSKIGHYKELDAKAIKQMEKVCKKFGDKLKVSNGKLLIEDETDIDLALKMLADYYKKGEVSGKPYGTYAGKQILLAN